MKDVNAQKSPKIFAIALVSRTLLLCTVPSIVCALAGRWIDHKLDLHWPVATLGGLILALGIVYRLVLREAERYRAFFS